MADPIARVLRRRLVDDATPLVTRLKLARKTLKTRQLNNKESIVIDWLVECLESLEVSAENERSARKLWKALFKVLKWVKKLNSGEKQLKSFAILPSSFVISLLNWTSYLTSTSSDSELANSVINCGELVLKERLLDSRPTVVKNFEVLNLLASASLDLLWLMTQCDSKSVPTLQSFVLCLLAHYTRHFGDDVVKVFGLMSTSLLGQSANSILSHSETNDAFRRSFQQYVNDTLINMLYKSPIHADFCQLLLAVLTFETLDDRLQYLVDFLILIQNCHPKVRNAFVVQMFEKNAEANRKIRPFDNLHYIVILCRLLGVDAQNYNEKYIKSQTIFKETFTDDEDCLSHLADLLYRFSKISHELQTKQEVELIKHLEYFQSLADFLLKHSTSGSQSYFRCFRFLLSLNSTVLVPTRTSLVLEKSWLLSSEFDEDAQNAKVEFLCALLDIYAKLRQIDKFVFKLMDVIGKAGILNLRPPNKFLDKFATVCSDLHAIQAAAVWNYLLEIIHQSLDKVTVKRSDYSLQALQPAIDLLKTLLQSVRLMDVNLSMEALNAIVLASNATARHSSKCLINKLFDFKTDIAAPGLLLNLLQLIHSWGELHAMLMSYDNKYAQVWNSAVVVVEEEDQSISNFLSHHFYISDHDFDRIGKACKKSEDANLSRVHLLLVLQKLKLLILFGDENYDGWTSMLQSSVQYLISLVKFHIKKDYAECWSTASQSLSLLAPWMSPEDVQDVASTIVSTFVDVTSDQNNRLSQVTSLLLTSREFQDVAVFQTAIVSANLKRMTALTSKLHREVDSDSFKRVTKVLAAMNDIQYQNAASCSSITSNKEVQSTLNKVSRGLGKILSTTKNANRIGNLECYDGCFSRSLALLDQLPLEYLLRVNRIRCLVQALCTLYLAIQYDVVNLDSAKLAQFSLRIATSLLNGLETGKNSPVFLPVRELLTWIMAPFLIFVGKVHTSLNDESPELATDLIHLTTDLLTFMTSHIVASGGILVVGFNQFLQDFERSTMTMLNKPHDYLVVSGLAMLRTLNQIMSDKPGKVKVCHEPALRLSLWFIQWFATVETTIQAESFDFVSSLLEAFGVMLRLESMGVVINRQGSEEIVIGSLEDVYEHESWKRSIPSLFQHLLRKVLSVQDPSFRKGFLKAVQFLKHFRQFLPDSIIKDLWMADTVLSKTEACFTTKLNFQDNSAGCLGILIENSNLEEFTSILDNLLANLVVDLIPSKGKSSKIERSLYEWSAIMKAHLTPDKMDLILKESGRFLMLCQHLLTQTEGKSLLSAMLMRAEADLLTKQILSENVVLILQGCSLIDLTKIKEHQLFARCFESVYRLLKNILVYQTRFIVHAVPAYLAAVQHLMRSIIIHGQQHLLKNLHENKVSEIFNCARKLSGLLVQMANCKVHFAKVAPYLIAFYVTEAPSVTLCPPIKNSLTTGIFSIMSICNDVDMQPLLVALSQSGREVFNVMYKDYVKHYRYTGKV